MSFPCYLRTLGSRESTKTLDSTCFPCFGPRIVKTANIKQDLTMITQPNTFFNSNLILLFGDEGSGWTTEYSRRGQPAATTTEAAETTTVQARIDIFQCKIRLMHNNIKTKKIAKKSVEAVQGVTSF